VKAPFLLACLASASSAPAADLSKDESRIALQNFANCMARSYGRDAQAFVETDLANADLSKQLNLLHWECMPATLSRVMPTAFEMQARPTHYRYALAEALLLRANRKSTPTINGNAPPLAHPASADGSQDERLSRYGECVVRASPDLSWALLKTDVASKEEKAALGSLSPTLAQCLAQDRSLQFGKFTVRGSIALSYYRLAKASGAVAGAAH
jgi:hypothetical protein